MALASALIRGEREGERVARGPEKRCGKGAGWVLVDRTKRTLLLSWIARQQGPVLVCVCVCGI